MNILIRSCFLLFFLLSNLVAIENQLQKAFYHAPGHVAALELGKVSLYFLNKPNIKQLSDKNNDHQAQLRIFIDQTKIGSADYGHIIKEINKIKNSFYTVSLEEATKPHHGIIMTISYNPTVVDVVYESFDAITKQHGLVFTFYNKKIIEQLKNRPGNVLTTVSNNAVPTIVIDAGHGGSDTGAQGFFGILEKDLTRSVGDLLADYLQKKGWRVVMTRHADEFVSLGERTQLANMSGADMMISLHANYSKNAQAAGIETFCMEPSLLTVLGSTENNGISFRKPMSDNYGKLSNLLADKIHSCVVTTAHKEKNIVIDRKVKHAVSQILLGSAIPTILIEIGFISNKEEATLLSQSSYQLTLVKGIYDGIVEYFQSYRNNCI